MKTITNNRTETFKISKFSQKLVLCSMLAISVTSVSAGNYQEKMLLSPSELILVAEARGRVMIYDGLKNETVEKAMDEQFSRIDSMMFVRTLYKQESGEVVADEDCDD